MKSRLVLVVNIITGHPRAALGIVPECLLQLLEQICLRTEVTEVTVSSFCLLGHSLPHLGAIVPVEGVTLYVGGLHVLAPEDLLEGALDRRRTGT